MEHSSSTSSSSTRWLGWAVLAGVLLVLPQVIDLAFGDSFAEALAARLGPRLERLAKGGIPDATAFFRNRIHEMTWLSATVFALIAGGELLRRLIHRRMPPRFLWVPLTVYVFVALNLFLLVAGQSVSFWGLMFAAKRNHKQPAFHLRRTLLAESTASVRGVIIGSSQGGSEIDDGQLTQGLYPLAQFSNLSYPGSGGFDFLLLQEQYLPLRPQLVVVYLNELNLYTKPGGGRFLPFLSPQTARDLAALDPGRAATSDVAFGLAGYLVPGFRMRQAFDASLFGYESGEVRARIKSGSDRTLEEAATVIAQGYQVTESSTIQKHSLQLFLDRNRQAGIKTVLVIGQFSPLLEKQLPPQVTADFQAYVNSLADSQSPDVVVLSDLPRHDVSDYPPGDLLHLLPTTRTTFTAELINRLEAILKANSKPG